MKDRYLFIYRIIRVDTVTWNVDGFLPMKKRVVTIFILMAAILTVLVMLSLTMVSGAMRGASADDSTGYTTYSRHYVMITPSDETEFWDRVYASALAAGQQSDAYVERFGNTLSADYDTNTLVHIAVQAGVDGIIMAGSEDEETIASINEAVDSDIPVVTVLRDSTGSRRQSYVGYSGYDVGREYGDQIVQMIRSSGGSQSGRTLNAENPLRVVVLIDEARSDTAQNLILLGIRETLYASLGADYPLTVETEAVDNSRSFSPEETIRDIFLQEESLPDILVCLSAVHTQCAYQAAVDYNKVGEMQILGYFDSVTILNAVSMDIIQATMTLDTQQMGSACVQTLSEYLDTGYTNSYTVVDTAWVTPEDAATILQEMDETE